MFSEMQAKFNSASVLGQPCSGLYYAATPDSALYGARAIADVLQRDRSTRGSLGS